MANDIPKTPRENIYFERWQDGPTLPAAVQRAIKAGAVAFDEQRAKATDGVPDVRVGTGAGGGGRALRRVFWITDAGNLARRPHRRTGKSAGRPRNDDGGALARAVRDLQRVFGTTKDEAVHAVARTVKPDDAPRTSRTERSMRERIKRKL